MKQYCDKCKKAIQITSTPLKCPDCEKVCHKYHTCSGIPPYNNTLVWKCEQHRDAEQDVLKCAVCNKAFGNPRSALQCLKCSRRCHRITSCSKISKGSKYPVWDCGNHQDDDPVINSIQQVPTCHSCNGLIRKNCSFFKCEECDEYLLCVYRSCSCSCLPGYFGEYCGQGKCLDCRNVVCSSIKSATSLALMV